MSEVRYPDADGSAGGPQPFRLDTDRRRYWMMGKSGDINIRFMSPFFPTPIVWMAGDAGTLIRLTETDGRFEPKTVSNRAYGFAAFVDVQVDRWRTDRLVYAAEETCNLK